MSIYCTDIGDILKRIFGYVWCVYGVTRAVYAEDEDPLAKLSEIINRLRTHYTLGPVTVCSVSPVLNTRAHFPTRRSHCQPA